MVQDVLEREVRIEAPAGVVWQLVSEPGWWIHDGEIRPHEVVADGDLFRVTDPVHGTFTIQRLDSELGSRVGYRWVPAGDQQGPSVRTRVDFFLEGEQPVVLGVRESGFLDGDVPDEVRRRDYQANAEGWEQELEAARRHCTRELGPEDLHGV